tara:strand:- start:382 stop:1695 length:1314 start_codon:yes stop_codon:yes gene_type:complete
MLNISINSKTSGKFWKERVNGREHIVTNMVSIVGDSVMNKGLYPDAEVANSFTQLDLLPAPNDHPKVNGSNQSAFHPLALNAHHFGAFVRNPRKEGKKVINELWVDENVAGQSDDGKELISRIENGKKIAVSTGVRLDQIPDKGQIDGRNYDWVADNLNFDHVAVLLNRKPAGDETFTINNTGEGAKDDTFVVNQELTDNDFTMFSTKGQLSDLLNEGRTIDDPFVFLEDCVVENGSGEKVIYEKGRKLFQRSFSVDSNGIVSIEDDVTQVIKKVEFIKLDSGDAPANNNLSTEDSTMAEMPEDDNQGDVTNSGDKLTVESAIELLESKGMVINSKEKAEEVEELLNKKPQILNMLDAEEQRLNEIRKEIVENSEMTEEDVADMGEERLMKLHAMCTPVEGNELRLGNGSFVQNNGAAETKGMKQTYQPNYNEEDAA